MDGYSEHPLATNLPKASPWDCVKCGRTNKSYELECMKCGHEPTLGRRDVHPEGRKYDPNKGEQP